MIPTIQQAKTLWETYHLPEKKRIHVQFVSDVSVFLAKRLMEHDASIVIHIPLLMAASLLHDIDKAVEKLPHEKHPESAVRLLKQEHMEEVAEVVQYHSVHFIANPQTSPKTWEEQCLFLADKMVKYEVITVDERFLLWLSEDDLPEIEKQMLRNVYPLVKTLEQKIFSKIGIQPQDVAQLLRSEKEAV